MVYGGFYKNEVTHNVYSKKAKQLNAVSFCLPFPSSTALTYQLLSFLYTHTQQPIIPADSLEDKKMFLNFIRNKDII